MGYFDASLYTISDFTTARGSDVNTPMTAIESGFNQVELDISGSSRIYAEDTGTANQLVVDAGAGVTSYVDGFQLTVKVAATNTGPATVNINSLGAKNIKRYDLTPLQAADIIAGSMFILTYDGTDFVVLSYMPAFIAEVGGYSAAAAASADEAADSATEASIYRDRYSDIGSNTGAVTLDCNNYRSFSIHMTGDVTLTFDTSSLNANDTYVIEMFVTRTGAYDITYTDSVDWPYQTKPAMDTTITNTTYQFMFVIVKGVFIKAYLISADI